MTIRLATLCLVFAAVAGCKKNAETGVIRLGYFPNVTHAQALVGDREGVFAKALGDTKLEMKRFNAGPAAMEALTAGSLDVTYVGSGPAINTYLKTGKTLRIIAGAVNGGAVLVVKTATTPAELKGKKIGTPQLGNTQDIALRHWLQAQNLSFEGSEPDVKITPIANSDILALFRQGELEGGWVPEPWGARLIAEGGGHILVDERDLWPDRTFATTVLVTTEKFIGSHRADIEALVRAHAQLTKEWEQNPDAFAARANEAFGAITQHKLEPAVLKDAFSRMSPAIEPPVAALTAAAKNAQQLKFTPEGDVTGMVDPSLLPK